MLSFLLVTLAIASVATNLDMKTNFVNYTTPESGRIMDSSGVTLRQDNARVLGNKSIARDKIEGKADELRKKKLLPECQGRKVCPQHEIVDVLNTPSPSLISNIKNMTGKVIIETQIQATYKKANITERIKGEGISSDNLITSSGNSVRESGKKLNLNVTEEKVNATKGLLWTDQHKSRTSGDISTGKLSDELLARNMNSIPTTKDTNNKVNKSTKIETAETSSEDKDQQHDPPDIDQQARLIVPAFSTMSYGRTSPLRSDESSESDVLSVKNLKDTVDFSGSSLRPTWETTQPGTVVDHNSDGKTRKFATILTTTPLSTRNFSGSVPQASTQPTPTKSRTYGVLKFGNETRRRASGPIADLKSHMEAITQRTLNLITTETSRDLETLLVDVTGTTTAFDVFVASGSNSSESVSRVIQQEIPWPVKKEAVVEGDLVLGGLMMVHEREDTITCGPVMPQGGIQALEAMLYTLDRLNLGPEVLLPNITLGAHILDDCDKDTYGLEMAVDFIKDC